MTACLTFEVFLVTMAQLVHLKFPATFELGVTLVAGEILDLSVDEHVGGQLTFPFELQVT